MDFRSFSEAIDLAIGREREAIRFYQDLLGRSDFAAQQGMLAELAAMEEGHARALEAVKVKGAPTWNAAFASRADFSDLVEDRELGPDPDYQDVLRAGIRKEDRSERLYKAFAEAAGSGELAEVFERLAAEESRHRARFEELYATDIARDN
ncbi:MAG: ferritin family protein [Spirochaetales bacterium]|nr:ferritin family protein [Spirochaetales bacterium]